MNNLNEQLQTTATFRHGRVVSSEHAMHVTVQAGATRFSADVAPSCLLVPLVGDRVLLAHQTILAVVAREVAAPSTLHAEHLRIEAKTLHLHAQRATVCADELSLTGRTLTAAAGALQMVGDTITHVAELVSSTAKRHVRRSLTSDDVHAASATVRVDGVHELRGDAVVRYGRRVVRIDGAQVQVG